MNDQPILTRKLKVCFEVAVDILPVAQEILAERPDLADLQQALYDDPAMSDKALAFWALSHLAEHLGEMDSVSSWMAEDPYCALLDALRRSPLSNLHAFLFEGLVHTASHDHAAPLFTDSLQARLLSHARVTDLESGRELAWDVQTRSLFRLRDEAGRYLVAEVQGENVLCLNLVDFEAGDILEAVAAEVDSRGVVIDRILAMVGQDDLSPRKQDDRLVQIAEVFPGLAVDIYAGREEM